jgi:hypothetical protein
VGTGQKISTVLYVSTAIFCTGRESSVGTVTRYGLDGLGIESRWEARFASLVQTGPGAHSASFTMGSRPFPGVKRPGRCVDHPLINPEIKARVELYLCSSSWFSWPVVGRSLPLPCCMIVKFVTHCYEQTHVFLRHAIYILVRSRRHHKCYSIENNLHASLVLVMRGVGGIWGWSPGPGSGHAVA